MRVDLSLLFPLQWCCDKPDGVVVWPRFYMNCPDVVDSDTCQSRTQKHVVVQSGSVVCFPL